MHFPLSVRAVYFASVLPDVCNQLLDLYDEIQRQNAESAQRIFAPESAVSTSVQKSDASVPAAEVENRSRFPFFTIEWSSRQIDRCIVGVLWENSVLSVDIWILRKVFSLCMDSVDMRAV